MNVNAVYLMMRDRYLRDPSWENLLALLGSLLYKFPVLFKAPLPPEEVEGLVKNCGFEVLEVSIKACHGLALTINPARIVRRKLIENLKKGDLPAPEPDLIDKDLARDEIFWKLTECAKREKTGLILIKEGLGPEVKTYALAHELSHHLLGHTLAECEMESWLSELHADVAAHWITGRPSPFLSEEENRLLAKLVGYKKRAVGGHA
ncbi:hypothetical protein [Thermosulfurimonas dismutans]|uniref:IrrE N-terminal-like domain-containing protein n=1 Tax=Thermosulfurimonas dismutans TaxID=999894 RepID=A0A179D3G2_9BACT|nr:hypothetical protein [Thermosulfurimonas dismutans]OAQ20341.1 hypothetical protein TDIS_1536 [Thermosulfurimonas dismutans]